MSTLILVSIRVNYSAITPSDIGAAVYIASAIELFVFVHRRNSSLQAIFTTAGRIVTALF